MRSKQTPVRTWYLTFCSCKSETASIVEPAWTQLGENADGFAINHYFIDHPEMILGRQSSESTQYGKQDFTVEPIEGRNLQTSSMTL